MDGSDSLGEKEAKVKDALARFIFQSIQEDAINSIDEIVLSYVVNILETINVEDCSEDIFDVDQFSEMMAAYIPSFAKINCNDVRDWVVSLASKIKDIERKAEMPSLEFSSGFWDPKSPVLSSSNSLSSSPGLKDFSPVFNKAPRNRHRSKSSSLSEDDDIQVVLPVDSEEIDEQLELLTEMFPHICLSELQHCLLVSQGDVEKAAQLIIHRQETGEQITGPVTQGYKRSTWMQTDEMGDKQLREMILNKYGFIDKDDDAREHRPVVPKAEPKKLIRYRDSKVVSVKGERFSEIKGDDSEEMKKTLVSLKPARQYRFH